MEHPTPDAHPEDTTDAVVLPEPRHDPPHPGLPPLIGSPTAEPTLPTGAGRPITPPATPQVGPHWTPGTRPGGGIHGHDQPPGSAEPLAGLTPHATEKRRAPAVHTHQGAPVAKPPARLLAIAAISIVAALAGAALALGGAALLGAFDETEPPVVVATTTPPTIEVTEIITTDDSATTASAVGLKVVPSIVTVEVGTPINGEFTAFGSGSGVVLDTDGHIATNRHVIEDVDDIRVIFENGRIYPAEVVGSDALTDLAVLRIDDGGLIPIERGSTEGLVIGDTAIAVGNPLGLAGGPSLTVGVVSAFDREVQVGPTSVDRLFGMLQTDAPITNGSSGGALVDGEGRLIGITTAIGVSEAGAEGIGFAIPVELVTRITDELIESGSVHHAFLGVSLSDHLVEDGSAQLPAGARITAVEPDTSAEEFGLLADDVILQIDDQSTNTTQDVINTLRLYRVGDTVAVQVDRDGEVMTIEIELGERPEGI